MSSLTRTPSSPARKLQMYTVDTFTLEPFTGNPAAVCLDLPHQGLSDEVRQKIAAEMNLSMTAFISPVNQEGELSLDNRFKLRWFTPKMERNLCGHATLASAFVLFNSIHNPHNELVFATRGGELSVRKEGALLAMNFPTAETEPQEKETYREMLKVLFQGVDIVDSIHLSVPKGFLVIQLKDNWNRDEFETWTPNANQLPLVESSGRVDMVMVTIRGRAEAGFSNQKGEQYDFASRIFTPWSGLPEDPVTGSAHTALAKFWSDRLGKTNLYARQCSQRPGDLWLEVRGDRTDIKGHAVLVMESQLTM